MPTPESQLHELLLSLFSVDELRRWIRYDAELAVITSSLPGPTASPALVVSDAVSAMRRRGLLDAALFSRLRDGFPRRHADIARVAELWQGRGNPSSAENSENPENSRSDAARQASIVNVYHGGVHISGDARVSTHGDIVGGTKIETRGRDSEG